MLNLDPQLMREACAVHNIPVAPGDSPFRMMRKLLYMEAAERTETVVESVLDQKPWCAARADAMRARQLRVSSVEIERQWSVIRTNKLAVDHFALDRTVYDTMTASQKKELTILLMDVDQVYIKTEKEASKPPAPTEESLSVDSPAPASEAWLDESAIDAATEAATEAAATAVTDGDAVDTVEEHDSSQTDMREKALQAAEERRKQVGTETDRAMPDTMPDAAPHPKA